MANPLVGYSAPETFLIDDTTTRNQVFRGIANTGATHCRVEAPWIYMEPYPGVYDFSRFDLVVDGVLQVGLQPTVVVAVHNPTWGVGPADVNRMVRALASRYPLVKTFEICNEQNLELFWPSPDPTKYVSWLKTAYQGIKSVRPDVQVLFGGLGPCVNASITFLWWTLRTINIDPVDYVIKAYAAGAKGFFDAMAYHPYPTDGNWNFQAPTPSQLMIVKLDQIRQVMVNNGDSSKLIHCTEMGFDTTRFSENIQRDYLEAEYGILRQKPFVGRVYCHTFRDSGTNLSEPEHNFGIVRNDFTLKPAYPRMVEVFNTG